MEVSTSERISPLGNVVKIEQKICLKHGDYSPVRIGKTVVSRCPQCFDEEQRAETREQVNRLRQRNQAGAVRAAGIPPRHEACRFENFERAEPRQQAALQAAIEFAAHFGKRRGQSLVLCGTVGTGKTHLACAIAAAIVQGPGEHRCRYATTAQVIRAIRSSWRQNAAETEAEAIEAFVGPDLLVLDEVGVQYGSEGEKLLLFQVLDGRYQQMRPSVIVGNCDLAGLSQYLGERVVDRLREDGGKLIVCDWPSWRARMKAEEDGQ